MSESNAEEQHHEMVRRSGYLGLKSYSGRQAYIGAWLWSLTVLFDALCSFAVQKWKGALLGAL